MLCITFMQRPVTFVASFLRYAVKFSRATCTRKRLASLIVHFAGAKCTGQMRQMRVRIRPSIPSLYYQTMQLPIGSAGSEFSRRASLRAYSSVAVSVFSKRRSGLTPFERMTERNSFREYDKRWMAVFFFNSYDRRVSDLLQITACMLYMRINTDNIALTYSYLRVNLRFAHMNSPIFIIYGYRDGIYFFNDKNPYCWIKDDKENDLFYFVTDRIYI